MRVWEILNKFLNTLKRTGLKIPCHFYEGGQRRRSSLEWGAKYECDGRNGTHSAALDSEACSTVQCSEQTGNIAVSTLSSSQAKGLHINGIKLTWIRVHCNSNWVCGWVNFRGHFFMVITNSVHNNWLVCKLTGK